MEKANRINFLYVIFSLLIVNYHTSSLEIPILNNFARFGFLLNTTFFFLSGYLLTLSNQKDKTATFSYFMKRRVTRIIPSLHITLIFLFLFYSLTGENKIEVTSLLSTATGLAYIFNMPLFGGQHLWFISVILLCYLCYFPTKKLVNKQPVLFIASLISSIIIYSWLKIGSTHGVYNEISSDPVLRFIYHYTIFTFAIFLCSKNINLDVFSSAKTLFFSGILFCTYIYTKADPSLGFAVVIFAVASAAFLIGILLKLYPYRTKYSAPIILLAPITYELYLIHYPVINYLDNYFHGTYFAYPLCFVISISLAFTINRISNHYLKGISTFKNTLVTATKA